MKKFFVVLTAICFVLLVGCSNGIKVGDKIVVEKQVNGADKYELYNEIKDSKEVKKVKDILKNITWENAKVSMVHPPEYQFHFEDANSKKIGADYGLWISPDIGKIELVVFNEIKYAQLDKEKSEELLKTITGKSFGEN